MDSQTARNIEDDYNQLWGEFLLWFGVLAAPVAWALHLQAMYVLTQSACARHTMLPLHLATIVLLAVSVLSILVGWRDWNRIGTDWPSGIEGGVIGRSRFLATVGVFMSMLFTLVIVCQWLTVLFFSPCV